MWSSDPFDGVEPFRNVNGMKIRYKSGTWFHGAAFEHVVVMTRGGCTFAGKVLRAQAVGDAGVIIIQTVDVWPYTMTDFTSESKDICGIFTGQTRKNHFNRHNRAEGWREGVISKSRCHLTRRLRGCYVSTCSTQNVFMSSFILAIMSNLSQRGDSVWSESFS
ncbi:hypothetical protein PsorP6_013720 [Peronosclerospora sorghi]|uniref:Uncharacterized protein n=1 Tax=Peronosclerospora sorghi TaxID=230839 RepID=A0ACC0VFW4_9STRA|nr:hypothetical protein PsorP6_013720 [Peronosclerospora sorghi]